MAEQPDVSVSIVNTSSRELLLACLASIEQDLDGPYTVEVVVLDNASEDGSAEAVAELFPWARVIAQPFRAGFGANHNAVIRATTGRYVYVLNEDATVEPGSFEQLVGVSRRASAGRRARAEDPLPGRARAGVGLALPDAGRGSARGAHARARRDRAVGGRRDAAGGLGDGLRAARPPQRR